jgi:3-deoxy-D-manno-octulosonic-acid transferase
MYFIYGILTNLITIFLPLLFFFRILKGKEDIKRFQEKLCIYSKKKSFKTIWIHAASVGELMSIIPILKKFENDKKINKIILTTSTTSSSKIFSKLTFKKTFHKYFPLDTNYLTKKFIKCWKPQLAIFVDSEIWPNMLKNLSKNKIPVIILNARITKKSFNKWKIFPSFAKQVFSKISLTLPQNTETLKYLKILGVKNIQQAGNLKYYGEKNLENKNSALLKKKFKKFEIWCAASTHESEEILIGKLHKNLKKNKKKLLTIIIPRHINRSKKIIDDLNKIGLKTITHSSKNKLKENTDIYLVDTYGEASKFYNLTNITFVGGSIIKHGGQNPLEPARQGNFIINGPNVNNFKEIYAYLSKNKISFTTSNINKMKKIILSKFNKKNSNQNRSRIFNIGNKILDKNFFYIKKYIT